MICTRRIGVKQITSNQTFVCAYLEEVCFLLVTDLDVDSQADRPLQVSQETWYVSKSNGAAHLVILPLFCHESRRTALHSPPEELPKNIKTCLKE